ncbi:uncharacterized protein [Physcomitrium patens]|uniref:uncharacterized protein isoform X2 n=1 Tax=Physcomitrium patens TaxID=3218 RepID=UPI000D179787|nr:uncharacterized protein LOC112291208 isoform X2 [Physcomitrium patens]|eukprot:XP_024394098.1 uncharacterized protein LOC112291208 isoform X2 [Physcomitrella patens]
MEVQGVASQVPSDGNTQPLSPAPGWAAELEGSHRGEVTCGIRALKTGIGEKHVRGDLLNLSSVRDCREGKEDHESFDSTVR